MYSKSFHQTSQIKTHPSVPVAQSAEDENSDYWYGVEDTFKYQYKQH